ncbi:sodium/potassium-transporting ATPase subunit alpha-like isoform X2 [Hydra vulgaris]|uniref:Sodium/potassium-transporting ATPase subunit alpha n=1 Tax=Hydra vulgaris TaxID=6087 RepID=A0ABM4BL49_HYDVU
MIENNCCNGNKRWFWKKKIKKKDDTKRDTEMIEHTLELDDLIQKLETSLENGLSSNIVARNLKRDGLNCFEPTKGKPELIKFLMQMTNGFGLLLLAGAMLCWIVSIIRYTKENKEVSDEVYLGAALAAVVFISGTFTYYQEAKSLKIMESFKKLIPQEAIVLRDGSKIAINPSQCVVGDVVFLKSGDRIPADVRIVESKGMKVDNSSLTGESEPQSRSILCTSVNPIETKNLGFFPTNVVEGSGIGIVVKVGKNTVMGHIVDLASRLHHGKTPLAIEIEHFIKIITVVAVFFGVLFFILYMSMGYNWVQSIVYLIAIIVSNVPEGLLCTVTVCLSLTAKKMAKKNCLVRHLQAVETLGSTSVILCDKTGTLTQNRMTVSHVWFDLQTVELNTSENQSSFSQQLESLTWEALAKIGALCSRTDFNSGQENVPIMRKDCTGDASEIAILKFVESTIGNVKTTRSKNKKVAEIPFSSEIKYQVSVHEPESMFDHRYLVVMKGAPEKVLERCTSVMIDGEVEPINDDFVYMFNVAYNNFGGLGERVFGFAHSYLPVDKFPEGYEFNSEEPNFPLDSFCFVGMMSMLDPPRAAVPDAVSKCRSAGIKIIMVTGDHPTTAKAIAKNVGIISDGNDTAEDIANRLFISIDQVNKYEVKACVVNGDQLQSMDQHELDDILKHYPEIVFARISPQLKLIIVEGCQRLGSIVAVTGDGLNDSPALKKADIGIAMGIAGSDVSKEAADIILLDDNFASIVTGVEEGRLIFDNLKKSILYTLTSNIPELAPFTIFIILNVPLPLGTIPMLCIAVTNLFPAISLAYESPENDIMERKPRNESHDQLVSSRLISLSYSMRGVIQTFGAFLCYFIVLGDNGFWPSKLIGLRSSWDDINVNSLEDSYGSEWNYFQRKELEYTVHTAFFTSIVVSQWGDLLVSKTRHLSLFQHGMSNWFLNLGLLFETAMTCFLQYTPGLNTGLNLRPIRFVYWLPTLPFACLIIFLDEIRKLHIRHFPEGWLKKETYY